jgi:sulfofructosephosphate aldolase
MREPDRQPRSLAVLARRSGAFAMLALDQRESLRAMLAERAREGTVVSDSALSAFKVDAARELAPHASAVLLDVPLGLAPVRDADAVPPGVGLIVAADRLTQVPGGPVEWTDVDDGVLADDVIAEVADAYKLLVIWRPDREVQERRATVERFIAACRRRGRPAIVEGVVRVPAGMEPSPGDHVELVIAAARELAGLGADLYKAEVPTLGAADDAAIAAAARRVTAALACPWVVLSNGTPPDRFDDAVEASASGGASGFLAGRAIWQGSITAANMERHLRNVAAPRLRRLAERMDTVARPWTAASRS